MQGIGRIAGDFSLSSQATKENLLRDDNEPEAGGRQSGALLIGEIGTEMFDADRVRRFDTMRILQPHRKALQRTAGR